MLTQNNAANSSSSHGSLSIDIRFGRANKTYFRGFQLQDNVTGVVVVSSRSDVKHDGVRLEMEGVVRLQAPGKTLGIIDALSNASLKSIALCGWSAEIEKAGRLASGRTEIPFEFCLEPPSGSTRQLYESYHGVYIAIQYALKCDMKRSFPQKSLHKASEFLVEFSKANQTEPIVDKPITFTITPETIRVADNRSSLSHPNGLNVTGRIDSVNCCLSRPLTGQVTVHKSDVPLKSIELQLIRAETCGSLLDPDNHAELSLVQSVQMADGDVARELALPLTMLLPRLFACSSLETPNFRVAFQLALVLTFDNEFAVRETFPLNLYRHAATAQPAATAGAA